jgi:hypothetical protein
MSTSLGTNLSSPLSAHTNIFLTDNNGLAIFVTCDTTPETTQANVYQKACLCLRTDNGTIYQMNGTSASPTWALNSTVAGVTGPTGATGPGTGATGPTGPTGP